MDPQTKEPQELRIALAMNGGVSLAVWIGGVTREFGRLLAEARIPASEKRLYEALCTLMGYKPVIDVIAGSSAGGVSGAYLALALSRYEGQALDGALAKLRDVWITDGDIEALLRSPLVAEAPSVLDGDGFYYNRLCQAFASLALPKMREEVALDLTLTATLLNGEPQNITDDFGASIPDLTHRAHFRFRAAPRQETDPGKNVNDFKRPAIDEMLAVAARSTSSFPGAFEPSFCPIWEDKGDVKPIYHSSGRPFMNGVAYSPQGPLAQSRLLIDGGVLDNKPLDFAIQAIFEQHATGPARRVLAYVNPSPGEQRAADAKADAPSPLPGLLQTAISALVSIPMVQSVSNQIDALRAHNAAVVQKRHARAQIARHASPEQIDTMSNALFPAFQEMRIEQALVEIIDGLNHALSRDPDTDGMGRNGRRAWLRQQVFAKRKDLFWVPKVRPTAREGNREQCASAWDWGTGSVQQLSRIALDLIVRAEQVGIQTELWKTATELVGKIDRLREKEQKYWSNIGKCKPDTIGNDAKTTSAHAARQALFKALRDNDLGNLGQDTFMNVLKDWGTLCRAEAGKCADAIAVLVKEIAVKCLASPAIQDAKERVAGRRPGDPIEPVGGSADAQSRNAAAEDLYTQLVYFAAADGDLSSAEVLSHLLAFLVVEQALGGYGAAITAEEVVEFIQVSGDDDTLLRSAAQFQPEPPSLKAGGKLTGIQLQDFAAFYKRSWRANDWLWGRRDAVARILHILLNPRRLREVAVDNPNVLGKFQAMVERLDHGAPGTFTKLWADNKDPVASELQALTDKDDQGNYAPLPETLPYLTTLLTTCLHIQILMDELPFLARQIVLDMRDGMFTSDSACELALRIETAWPSPLHRWLIGAGAKLRQSSPVTSTLAAEYLNSPLLGGSTWDDEVGSDQATVVVARMLAVGAATLNATGAIGSLLGNARTVLRWPLVLFYLFTRNLKIGSRLGASVNGAALAAALTVVATSLVNHDIKLYSQSVFTTAAAVLVASTLLLLMMIRRWWVRWMVFGILLAAALATIDKYYGAIVNLVIAILPGKSDKVDVWKTFALRESVALALIAVAFLPLPSIAKIYSDRNKYAMRLWPWVERIKNKLPRLNAKINQ